MTKPAERDRVARMFVVLAWAVVGLTGTALVFGCFPGAHVYRDESDCLGNALGSLFAMEHGGHTPCESSYAYHHTEIAGSWELWAMLVPIAIGALLVRARPQPVRVLAWALSGFAIAIAVIFATFDLDLFSEWHSVSLWPSYVVGGAAVGVYGILALVMLIAPIVMIARFARARRVRRAAEPVFPRARAIAIGR